MKSLLAVAVAISPLLFSCESLNWKHKNSGSKNSTAAAAATQMTPEEIEQKMKQFGTPGDEHKELQKQVGSWTTVERMRFGPDAPWMESPGTVTYEPILGGRYIRGVVKTKYEMNGQTVPVEAVHLLGFDRLNGEFTSTWLHSMTTWSSDMRGKKNADGNVVYRGMHADVVTPKGRAMRGVATWDGDDRMVFKLYDTLGGAEFHMMTWTAERVK